jgi:hypothetical protein
MKQLITFFLLLFIFCSPAVEAQTDSTSKKLQVKLSLNYNSNLNYYGRTDSIRSNGAFPMAEIWFTPKFYVNAAPIFVSNKLATFDYAGTVATVGYQNLTDNWLTNMYLLKPFYEQNVRLVQSALKAQSGITISRLNKILNVTTGADVKFSDRTDLGATFGLDHIYRKSLKNGAVLVVDPSAYVYAGTQNFSRTYRRKKAGIAILPGGEEEVTESVKQFNILAYEVSVPVVYGRGKWQAMFTPAFVLPKNLVTVQGRPDLSETGSNTFYTTLTVKHTF